MKRLIYFLFAIVPAFSFGQAGPIGTTSSTMEGHYEVMTFHMSGDVGQGVRISTNIPLAEANMTTVHIKGYNYGYVSPAEAINLQVAWYCGASQFFNYTASSAGGALPTIYLSERNGMIQLFLDGAMAYVRLEITANVGNNSLDQGFNEQASWYTGWQVYDEANNGTSGDVQVGYRNKFGSLEANEIVTQGLYSYNSITTNADVYNQLSVSGRVGIGTPTPTQKLDIAGESSIDAFIRVAGGVGATKGGLLLGNGAGNYGELYFDNSNNNLILKQKYTSGDLLFGTNSLTNLTIKNGGKVGIGTSSPSQKLDVNGNAAVSGRVLIGNPDPLKATNFALCVNGDALFTKAVVKLYANWPDYVFKPTYKLRPLSELEKYIKQNNHLPDVPSAAQVEKGGIDLGSNQAVLLKKVEELTLYIIEQDKKSKEQSNKLKSLEEKLNKLLADKK